MAYVMLALAIVCEIIATTMLKASDGLSKLWPSLATVVGYGLCFVFLGQALKTIPTGIAYAIWSGVGIVAIAAIARVVHGQVLDTGAMVGIGLILAGVVVMNVFSTSAQH